MNEPNILEKIVFAKLNEIAIAREMITIETLQEQCNTTEKTRGFTAKLLQTFQNEKPAIIAEIKKASPSKGIIRENFDPVQIAKSYEQHGATCLSVLTDEKFFQGHADFLKQVKQNSSLPVLRKDFIIDPYQIYQSRMMGADCILLIMTILTDQQVKHFLSLAEGLSLDVLIEVHNREELNRALTFNPKMIGINNRDLKTFKIDLETSVNLLRLIPENIMVITESGIDTREQVQWLMKNNIYGFLIGEIFMRAENPGEKLNELFS